MILPQQPPLVFKTPQIVAFAPKEVAEMFAGTSKLWAWGYIRYRDFRGRTLRQGFVGGWNHKLERHSTPGGFVIGGRHRTAP